VNYDGMGLEALRRMDKARDATVAFILKQIDKVDEEIKLAEELDEAALDGLGDVEVGGEQEKQIQGENQERSEGSSRENLEEKQEAKQESRPENGQEEEQYASPSKES
jgi:hypothetical protein